MTDLFELDVGNAMTQNELLQYAVNNNIIDITTIRQQVEMSKREKILKLQKIYESGGSYYVRIDGKLIKRKNKKDIEDIILQHFDACGIPYITFEKVFFEWVNNKLKYNEIQKQTYDRYVADFKRFVSESPINDNIDVEPEVLEKFIRDSIRDKNLTAKAWAKLRLILIGTYKWGKKKGYTDFSIVDFLNELELSPKIFKKRRFTDEESVFSEDEVKQIAHYINNNPPSIINQGILLAFATGLRVGELASLQWKDIKDDYIVVNKTEIRYIDKNGDYVIEVRDNAKTDAGDRNVLILDDAKKILAEIKRLNPYPKNDYVFTKWQERVKGRAFTKKLERICGHLGLQSRSMHKARKTYGTKLIDAGVSSKLIIRQMGHTNISTTDAFYHFNNKTVEQNLKQLEKAFCE